MKFVPHTYQQIALDHVLRNPMSGLLLDMGLGKTVTTLTAIADLLHDSFEVSKVLVIAPLRVAEDTWSRETEKWDHTKYLTVSKVLGKEAKRIEALRKQADLYVINRENVEWLVEYYKKKWPFDMVVIDELSSFKSPKAKRFRALKKVRPFIKRLVGLTGTPAPNSLLDLWPQLYLLDKGERLGKTITGYRDRYFQPDQRDGNIVYSWRLKPEAENAIHSKIADICISMQAKDWLNLPERIDNIVKIPLSDTARAKYKQLEKELLLPFTDGDVVAESAAVLANKLLQMANGAVYDEHKNIQEIHDAKLQALEDVMEAANGKPVLVFYTYQHDLARIQAQFKQARKLETSNDIEKWNNGEMEMLLAHPASAGHGLNLQTGGHIIVWFGLTWSLELYQQANARLDRQGQQHSVIVHHLVTEDTMDERVMKALKHKAIGQDALLEAVKARIERYNGRG
jgi:SNF2 family DNA or RNA helicase